MNPDVDQYLIDGCGRCDLYKTPRCKVHSWPQELRELRRIVQTTELVEEFKWSQPCYTFNKANVLIVTAFKDYACISFLKGSLLKDAEKLLITPGKNSQAARQFRFTSTEEILAVESQILAYIAEAIEVEKAGLKVAFKQTLDRFPEELVAKFEEDPALKAAFEALTPGRQRGYILHFTQPKQSATRARRIEKCIPRIFQGIGYNEYEK